MGDINRQRDFIIRSVKRTNKKRERLRSFANKSQVLDEILDQSDITEGATNSKRKYTLSYYLFDKDQDCSNISVCKKFFLDTLGISEQTVKTAFSKYQTGCVEKDLRGSKTTSRLRNITIQSVVDHINKFDRVESHYCRKESEREYLSPNLNLVKMYSLYKEYCVQNNITQIAKESMYRYIFNTKFNLHFFKPKKDLCGLCEKYKNASGEQKATMVSEMENHKRNKELSRNTKEICKKKTREEENFCAAVFDLEQVLQTPKCEVSEQYYRSKLSTYNLTFYSLGNNQGYCYMWYEALGGRGSTEIATCVLRFIQEAKEKGKTEFSFFSDNCGGQNRNRNIFAMYLFCAIHFSVKITHHFLEKGHTQNEGDSVHSCIEKASRNVDVFVPAQWYTIARTACKKKPYIVKEVDSFLDITQFRESCFSAMLYTTTKERVNWSNVKIVMVEPKKPDTISFKYNHWEDDYKEVNISSHTRKKLCPIISYEMQPAYTEEIPINTKKFNHLKLSCTELAIPSQYHNFFLSLKHDKRPHIEED